MRAYPTVLFLSALALIGYLLLPQLSIRWQPSNGTATLRISYAWAGANPEALEQQVTAPLEAAFALVTDVEKIASVSRQGQGSITLDVRRDADGDFVRFNVASQIRRLYPQLPPGLSYPVIDYAPADNEDQTESPVLTYALSGPAEATELYRYASEDLAPRLSLVPGLNRLAVSGGNRLHWRIALRPQAMAAAGLSADALQAFLQTYFARQGLGFLHEGTEQLYAFLAESQSADSLTAADWRAIPIPSPRGRQLRLGDLASVAELPLPATSHYRINGQNSVRLLAFANNNANRLALSNDLRTCVRALSNTLRPGYTLRLEDDATGYLRAELAKTRQRTVLSLGILLLFVLLAYRSWRRLGVVLYSLAVNLGLAFGLYWLLGVELNLYAFAGIAVSFGIMIDNVIIAIDGLRRPGGGPVAPAIIGATLTTLASLSVIWFLSEELRIQLFELARVMAINLSTSVLVALTLVPGLERKSSGSQAAALPAPPDAAAPARYERLLGFLLRFRKTVLFLTILAFGIPIWWLPRQVEGWTLYNDTIGSDFYQDQLRPPLNKILGGSFRLFSYYVYEGSGYRPPEETHLYVNAALPDGATLEQLNDVMLRVEAYLGRFSDRIEQFTTQVYSGQNARLEISFPDNGRDGFPYTLKNRLTAYAVNFGGVKWNIYGVGQSFSNDSYNSPSFSAITLRGYNQAGLDAQAAKLAEMLLAHPRIQEVNTDANLNWWEKDRYQYLLSVQQPALARQRLAINDLRSALAWFDQNQQPDFYLRSGVPVALVAENTQGYDRWRLENWSVPQDSGQLHFPTLAKLEKRIAPQALHKEDQQYLRLVTYEYLGSARFGVIHRDACLDTLRAAMPLGFTAEVSQYTYHSEARQLSGLMGLAIVLIFLICAILFESLRQAFNIVLLIPISCIGIFLTFYLFNVRLDQGGYTSFLLVTGLAVNGLILIVNEFNHLRKQYPAWPETRLYALAVRHKATPIVLTVLSTSAGLFPFLLGGRNEVFWHALAAGTIGGLFFSLLVMAVISPAFFLRRSRPALNPDLESGAT
ncbi:efflux RND transporter permease subunit [Neolewinella lacunae]|uniref:Efflux RND transporter permease subunit n=1 Tax=Neolewinella lacunae TaxID=1517758 RepID=A0A923PMK2_9BACT|nr:efflux RND transporter permease subunit [Neolewinella lacunae]MBC6994441.1 efflux RND transporter permease subunit [Neolewinella lacunae]MDN3633377.1 efflux RND transporter permease subunit [Neolewinella lacunae]